MKGFFRKVYSVLNALLVVEFLAQFFFIGVAAFTITQADNNAKSVGAAFNGDTFTTFSGLHDLNGMMVVPVTVLLMLICSFAGRQTWKTTGFVGLLVLLLVIQIALPFLSFGNVFSGAYLVSALHPVNGTILLGVAVYLLFTRWAFGAHGQKMAAGAKA
jgi:hypothetical protein